MNNYGAEKVMAFVANQLALDENDIFLLTYENHILKQEVSRRVNHIQLAPSGRGIYGIRRIGQVLKVRKAIKAIRPDVIISFLTYPNMISILASVGTRIPVIISERGDPYAERSWFTMLRDFIYKFADGYVFQTYGAKEYFNSKSGQNQ